MTSAQSFLENSVFGDADRKHHKLHSIINSSYHLKEYADWNLSPTHMGLDIWIFWHTIRVYITLLNDFKSFNNNLELDLISLRQCYVFIFSPVTNAGFIFPFMSSPLATDSFTDTTGPFFSEVGSMTGST